MNKKRQIKNRSGVALFVVLFVMVFLGILMVQFFANSQHAQRTAHKFYSSEIALKKYLLEDPTFDETKDSKFLKNAIK